MQTAIAQQLREINRQFYQTFGSEFSATRGRIQPGVRKIINSFVEKDEQILDLGCGNGNFAFALAQAGFAGTYYGYDFSLPLLANANILAESSRYQFFAVDLTEDEGPQTADGKLITGHWSLVTSFATMHHIPCRAWRVDFIRRVARWLAPGGRFIHSNWQFLESEKLKARIQPWERVGLTSADVDEGDYLLDWRSGGEGLRYVHHFSEGELMQLATESGFRVVESFRSDGANGRLGLYQVWERIVDSG
jgi:tRNA (uracil-5-)-methyltransferase TRM9